MVIINLFDCHNVFLDHCSCIKVIIKCPLLQDLPFVLHSLKELEAKITNGELSSDSEPVIIVGAGLSAADAIIAANEHQLKVLHIFRREAQDRNLIFKNLPPKLYPEYHQVQ